MIFAFIRVMKQIIAIITLLVLLAQATPEGRSNDPTYLPEVTVIGYSFQDEIYEVLTHGRDSVPVLNGRRHLLTNVAPIDTSFARLIVAQARLESGQFKSVLCVRHNNFYGMQHPGRGKMTTSLGGFARAEGRSGYASYATVEDSVLDLMLLLEYNGITSATDATDYAHQLKKHKYYESSAALYAANLKEHLCR